MAILLILSIYQINSKYPFDNPASSNSSNQVCFSNSCFDVELAITEQQKLNGLMNRESLNQTSGMLFIFTKLDNYSFWMKDTLIPLDLLWLNSNKQVVFIKENALPCNSQKCEIFSPNEKAKYVLEIPAFSASSNNITLGTQAEFK